MRKTLTVLLLLATPALAQPQPAVPRPELEQLLTALAFAPSEDVAVRMETRIAQLWGGAGGPTASLLMARGARNLAAGDSGEAIQDFDAALALDPNLTDAIGRRAMARYHAGDIRGAVRDLEETLRREPRHFGAWRSLSNLAEAEDNFPGALAAWKKLLEIDPKTSDGQSHLKELLRKAEGEAS